MNFGIDFGTTNSSISYFNNKYKLLKKNNSYKIPSIIYQKDNKLFMRKGKLFKKISYFKRLINNLKINNLKSEDLELRNYIKFYLEYLRGIITKNFNLDNINGVFSVPTSFNHYQRSWYKDILEELNFNVKRIISEPSAAAIAYYHFNNKTLPEDSKILVVDLGGGTTDISLLEKDEQFYQVIYNKGDLFLGGEDFTKEISENLQISFDLAEERKKQNNIEDIKLYQNNLNKLKVLLLKIKEDIKDDLNIIEDVILVGNGLKLIGIKKLLEEEFPNKIRESKNQEYLVAYGTGIISNELENSNSELTIIDSTNLSIGIETADLNFSIIIPSNSPLPASGIRKYLPSDEDEREITLKIYQGEHSLAEDNQLVGQLKIPANKNIFIDSIYQLTLKLDLNGIIYLKILDLADKDYLYENILKFNKISDVDDLIINKENNNEREIRRLTFEIKQIIERIKLNLDETELDEEEKNNIFEELDKLINKSIDYPSCVKNRKILDDKYIHLQFNIHKEDNIDDNNIKNINENYSDNLLNKYYQEKLSSFLDLEKIIENEDIYRMIKNILDEFDNYDLQEIKNTINDIENILHSEIDSFEEYKNLIFQIEYEIESGNIDINEKQKIEILNKIETEKPNLENKQEINYLDKINEFNQFCEDILNNN